MNLYVKYKFQGCLHYLYDLLNFEVTSEYSCYLGASECKMKERFTIQPDSLTGSYLALRHLCASFFCCCPLACLSLSSYWHFLHLPL